MWSVFGGKYRGWVKSAREKHYQSDKQDRNHMVVEEVAVRSAKKISLLFGSRHLEDGLCPLLEGNRHVCQTWFSFMKSGDLNISETFGDDSMEELDSACQGFHYSNKSCMDLSVLIFHPDTQQFMTCECQLSIREERRGRREGGNNLNMEINQKNKSDYEFKSITYHHAMGARLDVNWEMYQIPGHGQKPGWTDLSFSLFFKVTVQLKKKKCLLINNRLILLIFLLGIKLV